MFFVAILVIAAQDARVAVEQLKSDSLEVRDEAERILLGNSEAVEPLLRELARGTDGEAAARAQKVLRVLEVRRELWPPLLERMPGVDIDIATGALSWGRLLKVLEDQCVPPELRQRLVVHALAEPCDETVTLYALDQALEFAMTEQWGSIAWLAESAPRHKVSLQAANVLLYWLVPEAAPHFVKLLDSRWADVRSVGLLAVRALRVMES